MVIHNAIPSEPGTKITGYIGVRCGCGEYLMVPAALPEGHVMECTMCRSTFRHEKQVVALPGAYGSYGRKKTSKAGKTGKKPWRIFPWLQMLIDRLKPTK